MDKLNLEAMTNSGVNELMPYQPGKPIEELERELGLKEIVKLASNENPLGLSPKAKEAIDAACADLTRYPDGSGHYLKLALASHWDLKPEQITLGNGSNEVLEVLFRTFVGQGDEVIFDKYSFVVYRLLTKACGASAVVTDSTDWGHDLQAMANAITPKTKLICIANPNNPTGTYLQPADVEAFLQQIPSNVMVVLDEAYYEYVEPAQRAATHDWLAKYPNLLVSRTFSKAYGLAGLRIGYLLASSEISDLLNRVREPFNCNSLALAAAEAVLKDEDYLVRGIKLNKTEYQRLTAFFAAKGIDYIPSHGNFISINVGDAASLYDALLKEGVIVRPIAGYGMANHLRISIGTAFENDKLMAALKKLLP